MRRLPRGSRARAAALVVAMAVTVVAASVGPAFVPDLGEDDRDAYDVSRLVPDRAPAEGAVSIQPQDESGIVLVDVAHGNRMQPADIDPLLATIAAAGYEVDLLETGDDLDRSLTRADAFVVIDPGVAYSDGDVTRVEAFVDRGGRLLLIGEPTTAELTGLRLVDRRNRLTSLSSRFGFEFGEAYLFNMRDNDGNHLNVFAEPDGPWQLTEDITRAAFYTTTSITVREGQPLLVAGDGTRSSRTDATGTYPVAAVNGDVLAIADGTFLRRGNFNVVDNEALVRNVVRFLVTGEKRRTLDAYPTFIVDDPTVGYTDAALVDPAQRLAGDLRDAGYDPALTLRRGGTSPDRTDVLVATTADLERLGPMETGVRASGGRVSVEGYASTAQGVAIVRAPASGYDLVIVADTPARASLAVGMLADGSLRDHLIDRRTAVVRTGGDGDDDGA